MDEVETAGLHMLVGVIAGVLLLWFNDLVRFRDCTRNR
jgi:hypothetical protein